MKHGSTQVRWGVFALCCGTSWLLYLHRYVFALIKPSLIKEWGVSIEQLGYMDSVFSFCYMAGQVPLGILADLAGPHLVLTALILVWSLGLAMHAWAPSMRPLWFARITLAIGQSAVFAALSRISRDWFPASIRTTLQGWVGVFFGRIGGFSANLLFATLLVGILVLPWRTATYVFAGVGVLHALVFALLFRNSPRNHPWVSPAEVELIEADEGTGQKAGKRLPLRAALRLTSRRSVSNLGWINLQTILSTLADNIYSNWIPLFLAAEHGLNFKEMGIYSALPLLGGACGGALGGWLNDMLIARTGNRRWSRSGVGLAGKGLAAVVLFAALGAYNNPYLFCGLLFFVKFFGDWSLTTTWGAITDIGGRATASVFAYNNAVATLGAVVAPLIYGALPDRVGWPMVFVTAGLVYVLCAATWLPINCTVPLIADETAAGHESA